MEQKGLDKKIVKNTLMLYVRMLIMMCISLYTSRVILATLGVEDYGIYNVVGGFVAMFSMISGAMVGATQRFISFEIGKKEGNINNVFCTTVSIHIILAITIIILGETIGVWVINSILNFSQERLIAANWVFHFSLLTFAINIISIPYNAAIVAYEKMSAFAYISIIEAILKLTIVYLLTLIPFDKLIIYAILMAIVAISIRFIYGFYCKKHIENTSYHWYIDKKLCKTIILYTGWNFLGASAGSLRNQGVNIIINMFFGSVLNAAQAISQQVLNTITQLVSNFQMAMNPQIIKRYASGEKQSMVDLIFSGSRLSSVLLLIFAVPIYIKAPFLLSIWLKEVPEYTVIFLRISLCTAIIDSMSRSIVTAIQASGVVAKSNIAIFIVSCIAIPLTYFFFKVGYPPFLAPISLVIVSFISLLVRLKILQQIINFPLKKFIISIVLRTILLCGIYGIIAEFISEIFELQNIYMNIISIISIFILGIVISFYIGLDKNERIIIINKIKPKNENTYNNLS